MVGSNEREFGSLEYFLTCNSRIIAAQRDCIGVRLYWLDVAVKRGTGKG